MIAPPPFAERTIELRAGANCIIGSFFAMGSPCEVLIETAEQPLAAQITKLVADEAWRIEAKWSRYLPDSIVQRINSAPSTRYQVDEETSNLLNYCQQLWELSGGAFDISSGVLRRVWRFDGGSEVPSADAVAHVLQHVGWQHATWQPPYLTLAPDMELDFGGVGKEYAVDRCCALLQRFSTTSCLVNFGGDCATTRPPVKQSAWRVGIEVSDRPGAAEQSIELRDGALATSGDTHRFVRQGSRRLSHLLDARTGWPIVDAPASLTVQAGTCLEAGMLATLASLLGADAEEQLQADRVQFWVQR